MHNNKTKMIFGWSIVAAFLVVMGIINIRYNMKLWRLAHTETTAVTTTTTEITTTEETTEETTTTTTTEPVKVKSLLIQDMERRLATLKALIKETHDKAEELLAKQKKGEELTADDELYLRFYSSAVFEKQEIEQYLEKYDKEE